MLHVLHIRWLASAHVVQGRTGEGNWSIQNNLLGTSELILWCVLSRSLTKWMNMFSCNKQLWENHEPNQKADFMMLWHNHIPCYKFCSLYHSKTHLKLWQRWTMTKWETYITNICYVVWCISIDIELCNSHPNINWQWIQTAVIKIM